MTVSISSMARRQEIQQVLAGPILMEEIERTNMVVVRNPMQGQGGRGAGIRRDSYAIKADRERNCYSYGGFGYLAQSCRNQKRIGQERKIEYGDNGNNLNNLKEKKNLVILD